MSGAIFASSGDFLVEISWGEIWEEKDQKELKGEPGWARRGTKPETHRRGSRLWGRKSSEDVDPGPCPAN